MPRIAQEFADIPFASLVPGSVHRTTYPLTPDLVADYDRLVGAPAGRRTVVPPWLYCTFLPIYRAMGGRMEQGSVHARQQVSQHGEARVGDVLDVAVTVTEATLRKGRPTVVLDTVYAREDDVVCCVTSTILWGYASR
ncbi:hypothetical protein ACVGVM_25995 [Pseudonocardia bannensis]|uniref:N-terminal of MaoC-like dehydratase domain-containing protein n=1 Tax=Pseudonocardia bannensis TaxID=630973 RepID=A0A848DNI8_9PSEU|nr:hypothetical protein [Pseudonocardia bannensis]NMH94380.1 hypothetical protein [Pseudonocardia bannensis]